MIKPHCHSFSLSCSTYFIMMNVGEPTYDVPWHTHSCCLRISDVWLFMMWLFTKMVLHKKWLFTKMVLHKKWLFTKMVSHKK